MVNIDKHVSYLLKKCIYPSIIVSHLNRRKILFKKKNKTHTHTHSMWLKEVRKFKGLRFILVNSKIFNFFMARVNCCQNN